MDSKKSLHMNRGEGEASYARNSNVQRAAQNKINHVVEEAATDSMRKFTNATSSMVIADLGCSSGPNSVALVSVAVDAIFRYCALQQLVPPELCVLLNDLPDNDFNNVAKRLVAFQKDAESSGPVVTGIVPGSFYKRLFSRSSVHLALASNSVHWLSEIPEDLIKDGIPVYDADDDPRQERRPLVLQAYARQFRKDFMLFLNLRAQELVPRGQMVICLAGYCSNDTASQLNLPWDRLAFTLNDMVSRGVIDREKLDSFYIPMYGPSDNELRKIIEDESSFTINNILVHEVMNNMDKSSMTPKMMALAARAAYEPILVQHFGATIVEDFERTDELHVRAGTPQAAVPGLVFLSVSLTKKV